MMAKLKALLDKGQTALVVKLMETVHPKVWLVVGPGQQSATSKGQPQRRVTGVCLDRQTNHPTKCLPPPPPPAPQVLAVIDGRVDVYRDATIEVRVA